MATKKTTTKKTTRSTKKVRARKGSTTKPAGTKTKPKARSANGKNLSAIDAAAKVLGDSGRAMNCKELIDAMAAKKHWTSPGGKTPDRTLYAAILREIGTKAKDARFKKTERGKFAAKG